jgi:hypothetical protein
MTAPGIPARIVPLERWQFRTSVVPARLLEEGSMLVRSLALAGFALVVVVVGAFGVLAVEADPASAHSPHPGLDFSLGIDTNGDMTPECGTNIGQPSKCVATQGATMRAIVYLNSIADIPEYGGFDLYLGYAGVSSQDNPDSSIWPDCFTQANKVGNPGFVVWGCAIGPLQPVSTYTGPVGTNDFTCTTSGTVSLIHGYPGYTDLVEQMTLDIHDEGFGATETLAINCVEPPPVGGVAFDVGTSPGRNVTLPLVVMLLGVGLLSIAALVVRRQVGRSRL